MYQTTSPILFILYNRPDLTRQVLERIRQVRPAKLYLAADGARLNKPVDEAQCEETRLVVNEINWPCEVHTLFRDQNLGCKMAVSGAITWFFQQEESGIILEDDCLPDVSFFEFCDQLLSYYELDERIGLISGCNLQHGVVRGTASYYFSTLSHVWGWASWRRVWQQYDVDIKKYPLPAIEARITALYQEPLITNSWMNIYEQLQRDAIDTWDYQFGLLNFMQHRLSVIPNTNLISNIGFRSDATHTSNTVNINANLPSGAIHTIIHPKEVTPDTTADAYTLWLDFNVAARKKKEQSVWQRLKKIFKGR